MTIIDRLLGRPEVKSMAPAPPMPQYHQRLQVVETKAVTGPGVTAYATDYPLSTLRLSPQEQAKAYLQAYKVGWFYKAESKISGDLSRQPWTVSDGDIESEDPEETTLERPDLDIPFEALDPVEQFMRLMERPNPSQTGRMLRQKTFIRRDMAGVAFWYLEVDSPVALPTAIYGISPSRLWPSYDKNPRSATYGQLIGWVLDYDKNGGTMTFEPYEILSFSTATADDDDIFGVGVVEAVYAELPLSDLMSRHTADLLTTGGRLAGMMWPRERSLDEDEFNDAQRAWRNVVTDPNSARRLLLFPEPMEYATGASTPAEIGIPELAELNRTNILTAFPIAPEILGVPMPSGLNASGETRRELYDFYWEGTIEPRADSYDEVIQVNLLSRYEQVMGRTFRYETELPDLDDASSLLEKAGAFKSLTALGFDDKSVIKAVGLDHIKWNGKPPAPTLALPGQTDQGPQTTVNDTAPSDDAATSINLSKTYKSREDLTDYGRPIMADFLREQRIRTEDKIRATMPRTKALRQGWATKDDDIDWWDAAAEDEALSESLESLYVQASRGGLQNVADSLQRIVPNRAVQRVTKDLLEYAGDRIVGINEHTLAEVQASLAEGTRRGYSLDQLIEGVPGEGYKGLRDLDVFDDARAETIARTETMLSYNRAALDGYGEFGVSRVTAVDGDQDSACADRDGREFSVEDALTVEDHPNGTLDWIPVTEKAYHGRQLVVNIPPDVNPAPIFNLHPVMSVPDVHVEAPVVNVPAPIVNVQPAAVKQAEVQNVRIVDDISTRTKRVVRGRATPKYPEGPIIGVEEGPT